jgi:hypothetical protein
VGNFCLLGRLYAAMDGEFWVGRGDISRNVIAGQEWARECIGRDYVLVGRRINEPVAWGLCIQPAGDYK